MTGVSFIGESELDPHQIHHTEGAKNLKFKCKHPLEGLFVKEIVCLLLGEFVWVWHLAISNQ